jgi:prepilin-type N-terminal cleavage/methylation domain-containing protein/prepilin-type processing-associated H-X9-DG protein
MSPQQRSSGRSAFTLVELLAVISIIGVLAAILIPVTMHVRTAARASQCLANLRQLGQAANTCAADEKGYYPFGYIRDSDVRWNHLIYSYIGTVKQTTTDKVRSTAVFFCPQETVQPTDKAALASNYGANPDLFPEKKDATSVRQLMLNVQRPSQVILFADCSVNTYGATDWGFYNQTGWSKSQVALAETPVPNEETQDNKRLSWRHSGKTQVVFVDGHVAVYGENELKYKNFRSNY